MNRLTIDRETFRSREAVDLIQKKVRKLGPQLGRMVSCHVHAGEIGSGRIYQIKIVGAFPGKTIVVDERRKLEIPKFQNRLATIRRAFEVFKERVQRGKGRRSQWVYP